MAATTVRLEDPPVVKQGGVARPLRGFGGQFDTDLFSAAGFVAGGPQSISDAQLAALQKSINDLKPGHSRIAVRADDVVAGVQRVRREERERLARTIPLARKAGANVNLTWWHGLGVPRLPGYPLDPQKRKQVMDEFAAIIEEARTIGRECITHATVQNEVNSKNIARKPKPRASMDLYRLLYEDLAEALERRRDPVDPAKTLRESVQLVGGDLVARGHGNQDAWLEYMHDQMRDVLGAYSIHVYCEPQKLGTFEDRLKALADTIGRLGLDKPIYVTEYGVRVLHARPAPGTFPEKDPDGTSHTRNVEDLRATGFEHAWFNALAPQCGCVGFSKWVLYRTDGPSFGNFGMIDTPGNDFARSPTYRVQRLFNHLIGPRWKAAGLNQGWRPGLSTLVAAFAGPGGDQSVVALNRDDSRRAVRIEGLKPGASYFRTLWNKNGKGGLHDEGQIPADDSGGATVNVPATGLVALSTRPTHLAL